MEHPTGILCLDFVNTVDLRRSLRLETLGDYGDLVAWGEEHGVLTTREAAGIRARARREPADAGAAFAEAIELREALFATLSAATHAPPDAVPLDALNAALAAHSPPQRLVAAGGRLRADWLDPKDTLDWAGGARSRAAGALLTGPAAARLRECPGSPGKACGWLFVDTTKNGSRKWCVGGLCGNRTRAHRHYERERAARRGPAGEVG